MAEGAIVSAVLRVLHETIGSPLMKDFGLIWGVNGELMKLESTLTTIEAVLADAEERRVKDKALDNWLKKQRDVAYQADNLLDEFRIEALRRDVETGNRMLKKVRDFFSNLNQLIFRLSMGRKLKEVGGRLESIANERLHFPDLRMEIRDRETVSSIFESVIYGRDEDGEKIVELLMTNVTNDEDVSVIPIVGMGGVGKTTLAQLVYNHIIVKETFDLRMWICVSEDFDLMKLTRLILKSSAWVERVEQLQHHPLELGSEIMTESMEELHHRLQEKLSGKKFLLVLDDVWNEDPVRWERLRGFLRTGAKGSKIVVTTRSKKIASMMGTIDGHILKSLSEDDCWALFEKQAFNSRRKEEHPELVSIGKEIVQKCDGLPLAAKALGSLMDSKETQSEWMAIRDSEIWQLREDECRILFALVLSYHHLPSHLKPCFAYCALFPKDSKIDENTFIWLWIAEGLISSCNHGNPKISARDILRSWFLSHFFNQMILIIFTYTTWCMT